MIDFNQEEYEAGTENTYVKCDGSGIPTGINVAIRVISTGTADDGSARPIVMQTLANIESGGCPPATPIMTFNSVSLKWQY